MRTEIVVEDSRNPPVFPDTNILSYFPKDFLESKTSLEEDTHLNEFVNSLSPFFNNNQEFLDGATFAHQTIKDILGISLPDEVSKQTIDEFKDEIEKENRRRQSLNLDTDWYVKNPKSKNPEIYKRETDVGEKMLKGHLYYASSDYGDLVEYFKGFEDPQFKLGAFTVLTLKMLEEQRIREEQESQMQAAQEPIRLFGGQPKYIKSA